MNTLYHGTDEWRADCIDAEGFLGSEVSDFTVGTHIENGVVFLADTVDEAAQYGDVVFAVHLEGVEVTPHHVDGSDHFYASAQEINDQSWWERV